MVHAAGVCNDDHLPFFVSNMTRFGIPQSWSVSVYSFLLLRVSCSVENKVYA